MGAKTSPIPFILIYLSQLRAIVKKDTTNTITTSVTKQDINKMSLWGHYNEQTEYCLTASFRLFHRSSPLCYKPWNYFHIILYPPPHRYYHDPIILSFCSMNQNVNHILKIVVLLTIYNVIKITRQQVINWVSDSTHVCFCIKMCQKRPSSEFLPPWFGRS